MEDTNQLVAFLLERSQSGQAAEMLERAVHEARARSGDTAGLHYVRYASHLMLRDPESAAGALEDLITTAQAEDSPGWLACGLSTRASYTLRESERHGTDYDLDGVLRDMVTAEQVVAEETVAIPAINGRVAIALGYLDLRLYELVAPHYQVAYRVSAARPDDNGNCAMWLCNMAEAHLYWALELYQIGQGEAAASHTGQAELIAERAAAEASGADAKTWRHYALLIAGCARADGADPRRAAAEITEHLGVLDDMGIGGILLAFCAPFHAMALNRAGRRRAALALIERAVADLPPDVSPLVSAATYRTHALMLRAGGSRGAEAGLRYGDTLAATIWQHRLRTLHSVRTMKSMETLRAHADSATRALDVDALTGIANRRAFDNAIDRAAGGTGRATVLLIDTDRFKEINDSRGHAAGDAVLRAIAAALTAQVREQDLVARLGGDEFAALLPAVDADTAVQIARRMVQAVREIPDCPATISVGVAGAPAHLLPDTVTRADAAMYRAKRAGGDGISEAPVDQPQLMLK